MLFNKNKTQKGFSLLEVLVTLAIVGIVTSLAMVKYGAFNSAILLKNQAFEIALDLREAQVFAISVRGKNNEFREEYGLHFDIDKPNQYIFFLDDNSNNIKEPPVYDSSSNDEKVGPLRLVDSIFVISKLCVNEEDNCSIDTLDITFARPDFDASIVANAAGTANDAVIYLSSVTDSNFQRKVIITGTGQISVE